MDFPRTVEEIHDEYTKRRGALLRALTDDVEDFYSQCDPERENLCLYALRDGTWRVDLPAVEVPPETPEPTLGINFARDGMQKRDWLALVAVHSDAWLLAVAFFYGVKLDAQGRLRLFKLINQEHTLFEVVSQRNNKGRTAQLPQHLMQQNQAAGGAGAKKRKDLPSNTAGRPTEAPFPSGRLLKAEDINPNLRGRAAELFWPDNKLWYLVEIQSVNVKTRSAKITYATGEEEDLELEEILRDGHMALL